MTPQMQQSIQLLQLTTLQLEQLAQQEMMENPFLELIDDEEELAPETGAAATDLAESASSESSPSSPSSESSASALESSPSAAEAAPEAALPDPAPPAAESLSVASALESPPVESASVESMPTGADAPSDLEESAGSDDAPAALEESAASDEERFSFDAATEPFETPPSEEPARFDDVDVDWAEQFSDSENPTYSSQSQEDEEERDFTQYTAAREGLFDNLMRQIHLSSLRGKGLEIGEFLVGSMNEDGFFDCSTRALLALLNVPVELLTPGIDAGELRAAAARVLGRTAESLAIHDPKRVFVEAMARLLGTTLEDLPDTSRPALEEALLARRLGLAPEALAEIDPRERFLLAVARRLKVTRDEVEDALDVLQDCEPTGIGARDLPECLRLQAEALGIRDRLFYQILDDHLTLLQQKKFPEIARAVGCSAEDAARVFRQVARLEPRPARSVTRESPQYITPDVHVKKVDGKYLYYINEGDTGRLKISSRYRELLQDSSFNGKAREFALEKVRAAAWLIKNIEKRKSTILRVTEAIMTVQREFLEKGIEYLRPLTLREIADMVGMHESTIARVTTGKYVETPRGTFELKFFFSSGLDTDEGDSASSRAIKELIAQMIEKENPKKPLSDQKITSALADKGIQIARRTVAKYREQMKILPAKLRRKSEGGASA